MTAFFFTLQTHSMMSASHIAAHMVQRLQVNAVHATH